MAMANKTGLKDTSLAGLSTRAQSLILYRLECLLPDSGAIPSSSLAVLECFMLARIQAPWTIRRLVGTPLIYLPTLMRRNSSQEHVEQKKSVYAGVGW